MNSGAVENKERSKHDVREIKGRILKIKTGFNPNSSSIGVDVIVFFTAGAAMTVLFNTLAAVLSAAKAQEEALPDFEETPASGRGKEQA